MKQVLIARLVEMASSSLWKQVVDSNVKPTDIQSAVKGFKTALLKDPKTKAFFDKKSEFAGDEQQQLEALLRVMLPANWTSQKTGGSRGRILAAGVVRRLLAEHCNLSAVDKRQALVQGIQGQGFAGLRQEDFVEDCSMYLAYLLASSIMKAFGFNIADAQLKSSYLVSNLSDSIYLDIMEYLND